MKPIVYFRDEARSVVAQTASLPVLLAASPLAGWQPALPKALATLMLQVMSFALASACFALGAHAAVASASIGKAGEPLPAWTPGILDIHQISTARGSAALVIAPDGTSIMIDAGAGPGGRDVTLPTLPDETRRPGEWIARYALRRLADTHQAQPRLDFFVATHIHPDHIGLIDSTTPPSRRDPSYKLSGITDVAELVPITTIIDRDYPSYEFPSKWTAPFATNYFDFIASFTKAGGHCERAKVGVADQIRLTRNAEIPAPFTIRCIAANGEVWTGSGTATTQFVPSLANMPREDFPDENMCSIALKISYGKFDFFTGADIHCDTRDGTQPWRDIETPAARACGPVEAALADHHAYFDAVGPDSVRALKPQVWVVPAWHITHLNIARLEHMLSERLYPGPRDVFSTDLMPAVESINRRFMGKVKSASGHIVLRVLPGGDQFFVLITDNRDERDIVKSIHGPYRCQ